MLLNFELVHHKCESSSDESCRFYGKWPLKAMLEHLVSTSEIFKYLLQHVENSSCAYMTKIYTVVNA